MRLEQVHRHARPPESIGDSDTLRINAVPMTRAGHYLANIRREEGGLEPNNLCSKNGLIRLSPFQVSVFPRWSFWSLGEGSRGGGGCDLIKKQTNAQGGGGQAWSIPTSIIQHVGQHTPSCNVVQVQCASIYTAQCP